MGKSISKWCKESAFKVASGYSNKTELRSGNRNAYNWLTRHKLLKDACGHMVRDYKFKKARWVKGVYFLYNGPEIVYIGKSESDISGRLYDHYRDTSKQFTKAVVYSISNKANINIAEIYFISKYKPILNSESLTDDYPTLVIPNIDSIIVEEFEFIIKESNEKETRSNH